MEKTEDLFLKWGSKKYEIDISKNKYKVHKRQFWLYNVGVNVGNETSKDNNFLRPCLILNDRFRGDLILILPLTSKFNEELKDIYHKVEGNKYGLYKDSYLLLNQFKVISKKRLIRRISIENEDTLYDNDLFVEVLDKIKSMI